MASADAPLSYSSVRTYLECPLRWKFLYVDGLKEAPRGYFSFGRTVHSVLEELLRPLVGAAPRITASGVTQRTLDHWPHEGPLSGGGRLMTLEELHAAYRRAWVPEGYQSTQEEERYRSLGEEILSGYWADLSRAPPTPVAVEEHLTAEWDGIPVHGFVDRIDRTASGGLEIVDYKTSRELSHEDARGSDQLGLYQVLVQRNFAEPVEALTLYHLRSLRPLSVPPKPAAELDSLYGRVGLARDGIREGSFDPTPGRHCGRCEFRDRCPEFRPVPGAEEQRLRRLVDRFSTLKGEESRLGGELRSTAEELHRAAEVVGVHRIPGTSRTLLRRKESSREFPADAVRAVLGRHGLSGRLTSTEGPAVERLSRDPSIPAEARRELSELGRRRVRWYWEFEGAEGP